MYQHYVKRPIDVVAALSVMLLLSPIILLLAWQVKRRLGSPVLFRQVRPGREGRPFEMLKFRTMTDAKDGYGQLLPDNQRLTRFGRWLRSTSLDELPELWNVLRGDMSLIGPRPLLMHYLSLYSPEQSRRHEVRPGVTGLAQVKGRNMCPWERRFEYDVEYVDNVCLLGDLKILLMTIVPVLLRSGVSAAGHCTTPPFQGDTPAEGLSATSIGDKQAA